MSVKTAGVGHFTIPTAPAAGASCTSGAANVFTTTYVQLIASTAAALYITGIYVEEAAATAGTYIVVQLATGAAASETIIGQYLIAPVTGSTVTRSYRPIFPPIPVATATRIACKTADSVGAQAKLITLECIAQSNVIDDGITVGTVNLVNTTTTVTNQLTAAAIATGVWQDATAGDFTAASSIGKSLYIANVAPGAAGGHFIAGTNAATTITTGLTTTFTGNLTGSAASVTGAVGSVTAGVTLAASAVQAIWDALTTALTTVGSIGKRLADNIDAAVTSRLATAGYTAPLSAAATANAVWDELQALHLSVGTMGLNQSLGAVAGLDAAGVRSAVGLASANLDTQLAAIAGYIDTEVAAILAGQGALTVAERNAVADAVLGRNVSGGSSAGRTIKEAFAFLRNKWTVAGGTLTVYDTDDTSVLWTAAVTETAGADPVTGSDPA